MQKRTERLTEMCRMLMAGGDWWTIAQMALVMGCSECTEGKAWINTFAATIDAAITKTPGADWNRILGIWMNSASASGAQTGGTTKRRKHAMTDFEKLSLVKALLDLRAKGSISSPAVVIGLAIIENADSEGRCSVSRADLGKRAGIERIPTVSAKVTELRKAGFMDVGWSCRINSYSLPMQNECASPTSISNGKRYASTIRNKMKQENDNA